MSFDSLEDQLDWIDEQVYASEIEKAHSLPQIVKGTSSNAEKCQSVQGIVLLLMKQQFLRVVAQGIDKNCYVQSQAIEIPSTYDGQFEVVHERERLDDELMNYGSIKEVAEKRAEKFYLLERICVTLPNADVPGTLSTHDLLEGDVFTVKTFKHDSSPLSKPASHHTSRHNVTSLSKKFLLVRCERLERNLRMPYSVKASFANQPPRLNDRRDLPETILMQDLMIHGNFPLTVIVKTVGMDQQSSLRQNALLYSGMRLRLLKLEVHSSLLALDSNHNVVELASDDVFTLPKALCTSSLEEDEVVMRRNYHDHVRNLVTRLILRNDPSLVETYCRSVRPQLPHNHDQKAFNHIARLRHIDVRHYRFDQTSMENLRRSLCNIRDDKMTNHFDTLSSSGSGSSSDNMSVEFKPFAIDSSTTPISATEQSEPKEPISTSNFHTQSFEYDPDSTLPKKHPSLEPPIDGHESSIYSVVASEPSANNETVPKQLYTSDEPAPSQPTSELTNQAQAREQLANENEPQQQVAMTTQARSLNADGCSVFSDQANSTAIVSPSPPVRQTKKEINLYVYGDMTGKSSSHVSFPQKLRAEDATNQYTSEETSAHPNSSFVGGGGGNLESDNQDPATSPAESAHGSGQAAIESVGSVPPRRYENFGPLVHEFPTDWTPPDDVTAMSVTELCNSLRYIGFKDECARFFFDERIDGQLLVKLPDDLMRSEFNFTRFQLFKIKAFIDGWRPKLH